MFYESVRVLRAGASGVDGAGTVVRKGGIVSQTHGAGTVVRKGGIVSRVDGAGTVVRKGSIGDRECVQNRLGSLT